MQTPPVVFSQWKVISSPAVTAGVLIRSVYLLSSPMVSVTQKTSCDFPSDISTNLLDSIFKELKS